MAKVKEITYADAVIDFEKADMQIDDLINKIKDRKLFLKRNSKSRVLRYFWGVDNDGWFYDTGHSLGTKKPIAIEGMWIRKDLHEFLEFKKREGWLFYLETKNE
jgi:hypothetical protein